MRIAKWFIVGMAVLVVGLSAIIATVGLDSRATQAAPPAQASPPGAWAQYCSQAQPGTVQVVFLWAPSRQGQQWLDLSVFNNGFAPGTVVGVGPLSPDAWAFVWDGLLPGVTHYVRVNTLTPWGWQPGATAAFTTGCCGPGYCGPPPPPPPPPAPTPRTCCKICTVGKACGDTCISRSYTCHVGPGCACNG